MTFDDLVAGDAVFVDANVLTYYGQPQPTLGPPCARLLARIENQELTGFTILPMLGETAHRLMTTEAIEKLGWPQAGVGNRLRTNPTEIFQLSRFRSVVEQLLQSKLQILPVTPDLLKDALRLAQTVGLLINDATLVAVMQANGLTKVASHDADLDRVPGISRYAPV